MRALVEPRVGMAPGLHCRGVAKVFGEHLAVGPVSLSITPGEVVAFLGPSGCGKTTLLRILAGLTPPTAGEVAASREVQRRILMFQEGALFPWLTALGNVTVALEAQRVPGARARARAAELLASLGLGEALHRFPSQLSVGMKQRVAIARALAASAQVLLMDEPLASLDAQTRLLLQREFSALWVREGLTVVYVTHDPEEALLLADRVIVFSASPGELIGEFAVPLPRPRGLEMLHHEEINGIRRELWSRLPVPAW